MPAILGLLVAAAVDSHRRVGARRWRCEIAEGAEQIGRGVVRRARAQHRAVVLQESDIVRRGLCIKLRLDVCTATV